MLLQRVVEQATILIKEESCVDKDEQFRMLCRERDRLNAQRILLSYGRSCGETRRPSWAILMTVLSYSVIGVAIAVTVLAFTR
jgi:hypothetical protein